MLKKYLSKYDNFMQGKALQKFLLDLSVLTVDTYKVDVNKRTSVNQCNSIFNA